MGKRAKAKRTETPIPKNGHTLAYTHIYAQPCSGVIPDNLLRPRIGKNVKRQPEPQSHNQRHTPPLSSGAIPDNPPPLCRPRRGPRRRTNTHLHTPLLRNHFRQATSPPPYPPWAWTGPQKRLQRTRRGHPWHIARGRKLRRCEGEDGPPGEGLKALIGKKRLLVCRTTSMIPIAFGRRSWPIASLPCPSTTTHTTWGRS